MPVPRIVSLDVHADALEKTKMEMESVFADNWSNDFNASRL